MDTRHSLNFQTEFPESLIQSFYDSQLPPSFSPKQGVLISSKPPALYTLELYKAFTWLNSYHLQKFSEYKSVIVPLLLYAPKFSVQRLLFHYDGTRNSAKLIREFIQLFQLIISDSIATIISPNYIPKSKLREEQELIQFIRVHTKEASFIKFNFSKIEDFWLYATQHHCTLLVTSKANQIALSKLFFQVNEDQPPNERLSFYLSI
ncbi:MAG: hypothetical protein FJX97_06840 [Bacteroidetes bacterium]|nr:hypothetical protein [Bacteroidota bacterium]